MSDPIRYNVKCGDEGYQLVESLGGEWVRNSEYQSLKSEVERLTKAHSDALADFWGIHKGYFDLKAEVERLEHQVRYWRIEAECDHGRWLRCLEDLEHLRRLK